MGEVWGFTPDSWFFHYINIPWSKGEAEGHSDCLQEIKPSAPGSHLPPAIHDDNSRGLNQRALPGMGWGVGGGGEGMPRRAVLVCGSRDWDPGVLVCGSRELGSWGRGMWPLRCPWGKAGPSSTSSKPQASWEPPTGTRFFRNGRSTPSSGTRASSNPNPCVSNRRKGHC